MKLEEFIEYFNNISVDDLEAIGFSFTEMQELADYLKELQALKNEIEIHKKALELACHKIANNFCNECPDFVRRYECIVHTDLRNEECFLGVRNGYVSDFLEKARVQE